MTINFNYPLSLHLVKYCTQKKLMLTTAESCTGGGLSEAITSVDGSSKVLDCGFITYSNAAKMACLGVSKEILQQHGAVSKEVAIAMAQGALEHSQADIALSLTGIAGPTGGTSEKPIGTVWCGLAERSPNKAEAKMIILTSGRKNIRRKAIQFALEWLLSDLIKQQTDRTDQ